MSHTLRRDLVFLDPDCRSDPGRYHGAAAYDYGIRRFLLVVVKD
jgi:hypothetical protein